MRQGPDPRPMIKGWLAQIMTKLREEAPEEAKKIDFAIGVEVASAGETSGWILDLGKNRITARSKADEAKLTFYVSENHLRALSINLRSKYWREAFAAGNVTMHAEDPSVPPRLLPMVRAIEKREAAAPGRPA